MSRSKLLPREKVPYNHSTWSFLTFQRRAEPDRVMKQVQFNQTNRVAAFGRNPVNAALCRGAATLNSYFSLINSSAICTAFKAAPLSS
jgi:hypothetical protein